MKNRSMVKTQTFPKSGTEELREEIKRLIGKLPEITIEPLE